MKFINKVSLLNVAYILVAILLIGLSLPWAKGLDLGGRGIGISTFRGWNVKWLPILALIAGGVYITAYRNKEQPRWLWGTLIFSIVSLIPIASIGIDLFSSKDSLMLSNVPLIGFWITLIVFISIIFITARSLFGKEKSDSER